MANSTRKSFRKERRWSHNNAIDILRMQGIEPNPGPSSGDITSPGWVDDQRLTVMRSQNIRGLRQHAPYVAELENAVVALQETDIAEYS